MAAPTTFERIIQSNSLVIRAGQDGQELTVHAGALSASGSASLSTLLQRNWREGSEGIIDWSAHKFETIQRFATFLYLKDYDAPKPVPRETCAQEKPGTDTDIDVSQDCLGLETRITIPRVELHGPATEPSHNEDLGLHSAIQQSFNAGPSVHQRIPETYIEANPLVMTYKTNSGLLDDQDLSPNRFSYSATLMAHAEVYTFAHYYGLIDLQELALSRTAQTLSKIDCKVSYAANDLSEIIDYIYEETPSEDTEPMRSIFTKFVAVNYVALMHGKMKMLFDDGGDFTRDVGRKLASELQGRDTTIQSLRADLATHQAEGFDVAQRKKATRMYQMHHLPT